VRDNCNYDTRQPSKCLFRDTTATIGTFAEPSDILGFRALSIQKREWCRCFHSTKRRSNSSILGVRCCQSWRYREHPGKLSANHIRGTVPA
jgi:hypothetical protein